MAKEQPNDLTEQLTDTPKTAVEQAETMQSVPQTIVKKTGTALSLLAILVALGIGGAGYYFGQQQMAKIQQKLTALENQTGANLSSNNTNNNKRLTQLEQSLKTAQENIAQLEQLIVSKTGEITSLQTQMKQ